MAQRLTDTFTNAISKIASAIGSYTRADQGLPITMVSAATVAANTTQTVTITATVDCWVNGITTSTLIAANANQSFNSLVSRIQIAGFVIYENQNTTITPLFFDSVGGKTGYDPPSYFHGFSSPFVMRQGDVLSVEFQTGATAVTGSVMVDAYRCSKMTSG